jgi:hypothetical protein
VPEAGSDAPSIACPHLRRNKVAKAKKKKPTRKPYTAADIQLLKQHSKARTPVSKIVKAYEENGRFSATESAEARDRPWPSAMRGLELVNVLSKTSLKIGPVGIRKQEG